MHQIKETNLNPKNWRQQQFGIKVMTTTIEDIASENGLELIETTAERSGYPRGLQKAVIGFETFDEAEKLAKEYNLDVEIFTKRDGWNFWYRTGDKAWEPFERSAEDFGDDYHKYSKEDLDDFYENEVQPFVADFDSFEQLRSFLSNMEHVKEEIENADDDEIVIARTDGYCETIKVKTMEYEYDTHHYAIGLIDCNYEID